MEAIRKGGGGGEAHSGSGGGVSYDTSGFSDERGKKGGGVTSDVGGLDSMMVGRMVEAGFTPEAAQTMVGFLIGESGLLGKMGFVHPKRPTPGGMKGKQENGEEEEDENEMSGYARGYYAAMQELGKSEDGSGDGKGGEGGEGVESFAKSFAENPDIAEAVDASPFMEGLTKSTTDALDILHKSIRSGRRKQDEVNAAMATAVYQQGQLVKSQQAIITELGTRLGIVEKTPNPPKGATSKEGAQVMSKAFGAGDGQPEALNKAQLASALSFMRFEKGMEKINGQPTGELACRVESGDVDTSTLEYVQKYLATHPNEAQEAISYQ